MPVNSLPVWKAETDTGSMQWDRCYSKIQSDMRVKNKKKASFSLLSLL